MTTPLISIIIPVFNAATSIRDCIESILVQTYKHVEIIVIDDGSNDNSLQILKDLSSDFEDIKVYSHDNKGVSFTRNRGIQYACGEYIMFIDADDKLIDENYLYDYVLHALRSNAEIIIGGFQTEFGNESLLLKFKIYDENTKYDICDIKNIGITFNKLIKSNLIKRNNIKYEVGMKHREDEVFFYNILYYASKICTISQDGYFYFLPSTTNKYNLTIENYIIGCKALCTIVNKIVMTNKLCENKITFLEKRIYLILISAYWKIFDSINKNDRVRGYKSIDWSLFIKYSNCNSLIKYLMHKQHFTILDCYLQLRKFINKFNKLLTI